MSFVRHFHPQGARTEVVIALYTDGIFKRGGRFDGSYRVCVILKVMPDDKSRIVIVSPRTELDDREIGSPESRLDCMAVNEICIHGRVINGVSDKRIHCAMVDKIPLAVLPGREQRSKIAIGNDCSAAIGRYLEHVVIPMNCRG